MTDKPDSGKLLTEEEARKLAEEHWDWLEPVLRLCELEEEEIQRQRYLYITAMMHGVKHGEKQNDREEIKR